jgi:tetratricopeptide (TPR) repeat protein
MRRLIFLVLAFVGATVHSQDTPVGAQPIDPLGTPPPQRATTKQQVDALGSSQSSEPEASEPGEALALLDPSDPLEPLGPSAQDRDETWVMDDQIAQEEVAAYDEVRIVLDPGSVEEAQELVKFAALQLESSEYGDAVRTVNASVVMLEEHLGRYDPKLIEPLTLLGQALHGEGDYPEAIDAYQRAVHVSRINGGLHSTEQVPIIYQEADSWVATGDVEHANERHVYAYETLLRAYGPQSVEMVPGMYKLAHWYSQQNNIFSARGLYQYAAHALSLAYGMQDTRLIPALQGIAKTYRLERFPPYQNPSQSVVVGFSAGPSPHAMRRGRGMDVNRFGDGEGALQQVVRIQEANPEATVRDLAVAILELADWNLLFERWTRAFTLYEYGYKIMAEQGQATEEQLASYFGEPRPLYLPLPGGPTAPPTGFLAVPTQGFVEMAYTVTERGQIRKLKTVTSEPPELMDFKVRKAMRHARFRPRIEAGITVSTPNLMYRHRFQYFPLPEAADPSAERSARSGENAAPDAS